VRGSAAAAGASGTSGLAARAGRILGNSSASQYGHGEAVLCGVGA
jgi:hypothetical protein